MPRCLHANAGAASVAVQKLAGRPQQELAAIPDRSVEFTRKEQRAMLFGLVDERHVSPLGQPGPLAT